MQYRTQAIILSLLAFALYAQTLRYEYVLDDKMFITDHKAVQSGVKGIPELLTKHSMYSSATNINQGRYRPLTFISFALEQEIAPNQAWLGHLVNCLLYALTAPLLLAVLRQMLVEYHPLLPVLTTLFFVLHPIHTEVVANIKSRDLLLSLIFCLLALRELLLYHRAAESASYVESPTQSESRNSLLRLLRGSLWMALALLSQEGAITFVAVLPLTIYWFTRARWRTLVGSCVPFFLAAGLVLALRAVVVGTTDDSWMAYITNYLYVHATPMDALATKTAIMGRYLVQAIFPVVMAADYGYKHLEVISWAHWQPIASVLVHGVIVIWAFVAVRQRHIVAYCVLFYCATMSIASNYFIYYGMAMSDRLLYAPSAAVMITLGWGLLEIFRLNTPPFTHKVPSGLIAVICVIGALYAVRTLLRNPDWQSDYTLNKAGVRDTPRCLAVQAEFGRLSIALAEATTDPLARTQYMREGYNALHTVISMDTMAVSAAYASLGHYFRRLDKRFDSAVYYYDKALRLDTLSAIRFNAITVRADSALTFQHYDRARELYLATESMGFQPEAVAAKIGITYFMQERYHEALPYFERSLQYNPNYGYAAQLLNETKRKLQGTHQVTK
jgi:mannose/fructose/N-acetylgalactosamine-specific phosphotransferase system component IIC